MRLYIVRHAHAGSRRKWTGDDRLRPLSKKGERQAAAIGDLLAGVGVRRLLSSPYVRCIETLLPLASRVGVGLDSDDRLAEGAGYEGAWPLVDEVLVARENTVICSHGDVIPAVLEAFVADGAQLNDVLAWPKASIWVITAGDHRWFRANYLAPPPV